MRAALALAAFVLIALVGPAARADGSPSVATFALVIGSNQSVDSNLAPLRYADDDAARYLDLFRLLGARTYLLSRLDDNTRRLHPQAAAEAVDPRQVNLDAAVAQLIADVTKAKERGVETVVYFVYAGHGNVKNGEGYLTLEDARITGGDLARIFARVPAARIHVIADACASYFLAYSRGPGGERRSVESFGIAPALGADPRVGLLLSTSSARESHEWDAFQAGVFSHEVRSGLYGAADANGDGQVSYREIAAFVARANERIANERFRPDVHARAPRGADTLLDLRAAGRKLEVSGKHAGHFYLEDARGVRIADFHNAEGQRVSLVRPPPSGNAYLRRVDGAEEFLVEGGPEVVALADLSPAEPRTAARGAAHESFGEIFVLPFGADVVAIYVEREPPPPEAPRRPPAPRDRKRAILGTALLATGGAALATGAALSLSANALYQDIRTCATCSQQKRAETNATVGTREDIALGFYLGGSALAFAGLVMLLLPDRGVRASVSSAGATLGWGRSF